MAGVVSLDPRSDSLEIEHEAGDENCCEAKMHAIKHRIAYIEKETLNGSEILVMYDVLEDGMCKAEFWSIQSAQE